jgi:flagellar biosynthetic protein FliQ
MTEHAVVDLFREAMLTAGMVAAPILLVGLTVGLVIGVVQAATGVQEQTVGHLPRLAAMAGMAVLLLPWMLETFVQLFRTTAVGP